MTDDLYERYKEALRVGHVAVLRGALEEATEAYRLASAIAPSRALPHTSLGGVLLRLGHLEEALVEYAAAVARAPHDEGALLGQAEALAMAGQRVDAAAALDHVSEIQEAAGRLPEAADTLRRAIEFDDIPDRSRRQRGLLRQIRLSAGDQAAEQLLARALRLRDEPGGGSADLPRANAPAATTAPPPESEAPHVRTLLSRVNEGVRSQGRQPEEVPPDRDLAPWPERFVFGMEAERKREPAPAAIPEPELQPEPVAAAPEPEFEPEPVAAPEPEPEPAVWAAEPEPEPEPKLGREPEPEPEPVAVSIAERQELEPVILARAAAAVGVMEGAIDTAIVPAAIGETQHQPTGDELLAASEAAEQNGDSTTLRSLLLWTSRAYAREGRFAAGLDAAHRLLQRAPGDVDAHLVLVELYIARDWNGLAAEKLALLGRLAELNGDEETRQRLCAVASRAFPKDERLGSLCA